MESKLNISKQEPSNISAIQLSVAYQSRDEYKRQLQELEQRNSQVPQNLLQETIDMIE
jgi:hypothetical protein